MKFERSHKNSGGFTLTEMLITITIAAILMAIGIPSYRSITSSGRISGEVNGLLGDLQLARSEAIKQGTWVTVCVSTDGATCAGSGTNWDGGWIVFADSDNDRAVDAGGSVLKVQATFVGGDTFVASNAVRAIVFNREGFATLYSGTTTYPSTLVTLHAAIPTTA